MDYTQKNHPVSLNMDKARKNLSETEAFYLLNHERYVTINGNNGSIGKTTPFAANYPACELEQPFGEVYSIGTYRSHITNEVYSFHYNSNGVHYILRITNYGCDVVYVKQPDDCFNVRPNPRHSIEQWRVYLKVDLTCKNQHGKQLIWCDGSDTPIGQVDVEASIATNYFTTPFFDICPNPCAPIMMCVPKPPQITSVEAVTLNQQDAGLTNNILDTPFMFMVKHHYYDNIRASEWSDFSSTYFIDTSGCFDFAGGLPRCFKLRVPIGNPLVDKIEIAYSKDGVNWFTTEIVDKYKSYTTDQQYWYERQLSEQVASTYSDVDCCFDYYFCNDKQCDQVPSTQVQRVYNPIPREAQCLIPLKDAIGFVNYKKGTCPIDKIQADKVSLDLNCGDNDNKCTQSYVTVTVRAVIHNFLKNKNQFIYRMGAGGEDDPADTAYFGGVNHIGNSIGDVAGGFEVGYDQYFNDKTRNFIPYIEGTDVWKEMEQWHSSRTMQNVYKIGTVSDMENRKTQRKWDGDTDDGFYFYQEAIFKVKKGTRGFIRLASHHATNGVGANQDTSTFVVGTIDLKNYRGDRNIVGYMNWNEFEIPFDTCNGDVILNKAFVIRDNAVDKGLQKKASAYHGYIKDDSGRPVEGVIVNTSFPPLGPTSAKFVTRTDHNGFYHFYLDSGKDGALDLYIFGENNCSSPFFSNLKKFNVSSVSGDNIQSDQTLDYIGYVNNYYAIARVKVVDCSNNAVSGVRIALSGSKYRSTDVNGVAEFIIRNYYTRNRSLTAILMDVKGCIDVDCGGNCNSCMPTVTGVTPACYSGKPIVTLPQMQINKASASINKMGLKNGGRYGFGFIIGWECSKITNVNELTYFNIPKAQESNGVFYCGFKFDFTKNGQAQFPTDASYIQFVRTDNLNPYVLQWVVDKIERTAHGEMRLTIQSLNDYNAEYNFKTNTSYSYLKGDRVEFIKNGDGKIFDIATHGLLNYLTISPFHDKVISGQTDAAADYFNQLLIKDDGKLNDLVEGAIIEIQRSPECNEQPTYYVIPNTTIPLVNGIPIISSGSFTTFDTFVVHRQINEYSLSFEHHSPSDFWGDHVSDRGKAFVVNKYENERKYGRNITICASNQINYFGDLEKTFDAPEQGDIIAVGIKDGKIILAIGQRDSFLAQAADDLLRVGSDGIIRALPADAIISDAQPKISGEYGCDYDQAGSVFFGDGFSTWYDINKTSYIKHDYSQAEAVSDGRVQSYFTKRGQDIFNSLKLSDPLDQLRFCTGINNVTGSLYITIKKLRDSGFNNEKQPYLKSNETIVYHPKANDWLGFISPTPEAYCDLDYFGEDKCAFAVFLHGVPFIHPATSSRFNEFFGVPCDRVIGIVLNKYSDKIKNAISIELQDEFMWYVSKVSTDKPNFLSEIPPKKWQKNGRKWNASFLRNINSAGGLFNGEITSGYDISITFVRDNTDGLKYGTIDNSKRLAYDELDNILFKFSVKEQSGFTNNI
jgi:hypothetical protein